MFSLGNFLRMDFCFLHRYYGRKRVLRWLSIIGFITSFLLCSRLLFIGAHAEISEHHIFYNIYSPPALIIINSLLYVVCTLIPGFVSRFKHMKLLTVLMAGSLIVSRIFYQAYLVSVWCFFAAVISAFILYIMAEQNAHVHSYKEGKVL
jgi:hypothetical protein